LNLSRKAAFLPNAGRGCLVLRHIRLLILDLDYVVFDCALVKVQALRQSLISLAEAIPESTRLPDASDVEEAFRSHGFRWPQFMEIGLSEERLGDLQQAYGIHESRLIHSGIGKIFPGIGEFISACKQENLEVALGADASREYLISVTETHNLDRHFDIMFCTEEFGIGGTQEMLGDIMYQAEVNPSEVVVLGTRPQFFQAAHDLDILTIGCGWGIRLHEGLAEADLQPVSLAQLSLAIEKADDLASRYSN
jgi:phosphoglycolate phosphatase-like HAD superfamily hydrolase